ncbi:hypothetical protein [Acidisoma silvae]|uniref:Uncharacterized protein n=1 Tax=Acidisoma silvae TaxID=2802396 RepID=A0A964E1N9_9PROT|nr:hypothetical protein [Acidisoma silvae]MCB8878447.1 hypothetical protein [Acidisoma silvae]
MSKTFLLYRASQGVVSALITALAVDSSENRPRPYGGSDGYRSFFFDVNLQDLRNDVRNALAENAAHGTYTLGVEYPGINFDMGAARLVRSLNANPMKPEWVPVAAGMPSQLKGVYDDRPLILRFETIERDVRGATRMPSGVPLQLPEFTETPE